MKQYLLSVYMVDGEPTPSAEEQQQIYRDVDEVNAELKSAGAWVFAGGLHPASTATVVRAKDGEIITTDGPFAETKEQIAGFDILDCTDLDEAIEVASKHPVAKFGILEVRPFWVD